MKRRLLTALATLAVAVAAYLASQRSPARPERGPERPESPAAAQAPTAAQAPAAAQAPMGGPGEAPDETPEITVGEGKWSETRPAVNLEHIFEGEVNKRGKPVGFHARPGGKDPDGARVVRVVQGPNRAGVYIADVEIRNESGRWLKKRSTFYPDRLSREDVVAAVLHAWNHRQGRKNPFRGPSGEGFEIEGRPLDNGDINTAYPIFDEGE
jgi:hypothetical protein